MGRKREIERERRSERETGREKEKERDRGRKERERGIEEEEGGRSTAYFGRLQSLQITYFANLVCNEAFKRFATIVEMHALMFR